jgi:cbb3-type cytochrome oxidase subunit 3
LNPLFLTVVMLVFVGVLFLIVRAERKSKLSQ